MLHFSMSSLIHGKTVELSIYCQSLGIVLLQGHKYHISCQISSSVLFKVRYFNNKRPNRRHLFVTSWWVCSPKISENGINKIAGLPVTFHLRVGGLFPPKRAWIPWFNHSCYWKKSVYSKAVTDCRLCCARKILMDGIRKNVMYLAKSIK